MNWIIVHHKIFQPSLNIFMDRDSKHTVCQYWIFLYFKHLSRIQCNSIDISENIIIIGYKHSDYFKSHFIGKPLDRKCLKINNRLFEQIYLQNTQPAE